MEYRGIIEDLVREVAAALGAGAARPPMSGRAPLRQPVGGLVLSRRHLFSAGACLPFIALAAAEGRELPVAERFILTLGERTIALLNQTGIDETVRLRGIAQLLEEAVDLDAIARFVLGRSWQQASAAQLRDYVGLFRAYTLGTLAQRLGGYTGNRRFVVTGSRPVGESDSMVTTRILYPDYPPLEIAWRVRNDGQRLTIVDVTVEQISLVVTTRSEFASIVGQRGIDGLLQELQAHASRP